MKYSASALLVFAATAAAQIYGHPRPHPGSPDDPIFTPSSSLSLVPTTVSPSIFFVSPTSSSIPVTTSPPSSIEVVGPTSGKVTPTVTDTLTSYTCDLCDHTYTTEYTVDWINTCSTGLTTPVYTITETCTGNPASFTPTSSPAGFTVYTTVCTQCENPESTITITEPCSTTTSEPAPPPPPATTPAPPYTTPAPPKVKPAGGTTYPYPPAKTTGPQQITVNGASGSNVQFITLVVSIMSSLFAGMIML